MNTSILLDCDDVLLNWIEGYGQYAAAYLGHDVTGLPGSWSLSEWLGTTDEVAWQLIDKFNESLEFGRLNPIAGAYEALLTLYDNGAIMHVITSCSAAPIVTQRRRENLKEVFGDIFNSIHCLDLHKSKQELLQAWAPGAVWIEDSFKNANHGHELGHTCLVHARPHNAKFRTTETTDDFIWFDNWSEVPEIVTKLM